MADSRPRQLRRMNIHNVKQSVPSNVACVSVVMDSCHPLSISVCDPIPGFELLKVGPNRAASLSLFASGPRVARVGRRGPRHAARWDDLSACCATSALCGRVQPSGSSGTASRAGDGGAPACEALSSGGPAGRAPGGCDRQLARAPRLFSPSGAGPRPRAGERRAAGQPEEQRRRACRRGGGADDAGALPGAPSWLLGDGELRGASGVAEALGRGAPRRRRAAGLGLRGDPLARRGGAGCARRAPARALELTLALALPRLFAFRSAALAALGRESTGAGLITGARALHGVPRPPASP